MPLGVSLGPDAVGTAQSLRSNINNNPDLFACTASGDGDTLTLTSIATGEDVGTITLAASGASPTFSSSSLVASSRIRDLIGGFVSNLRGVTTLFYEGLICSNNPYPKAWKYRVIRTDYGWDNNNDVWYPETVTIPLTGGQILAMNPAHIIYQCLTDPSWGRGLPRAALDDAAFRAAALYLFGEGFGLCFKWSGSTTIDDFIQTVIDHIGGALYTDRQTGLLVLKLIRADYDPASLPIFDYTSGLLEIKSDDSAVSATAPNEVVVTYTDPIQGVDATVRVQALASLAATGSLSSTATGYPGIPEAGLASRVAYRDLQLQANGIRRFDLTFDRRGRKIQPASVFKISVPSRGIEAMILRAGKVGEGPLTTNTVTVTAVQDVFGLEDTVYIKDVTSTWVPPDTSVRAIDTRRWREASYRDVVRFLAPADLAVVPIDGSYICTAAKAPTSLSVDYVLNTSVAPAPYASYGAKGWAPTGLLSFSINRYTTDIVLTGFTNLADIGNTGGVCWIDAECCKIVDYNATTGTVTIGRGCLDSIPDKHAQGARVWFPDLVMGTDYREYTTGETVLIKMQTRTNALSLDLASTPEDSVVISGRQGRPYPPGNLAINGTRYADVAVAHGEITFTWAHRNRINQSDFIVTHEEAGTTPEPGTSYTIQIFDANTATLVRTVTGLTGETWTYTASMIAADGASDKLTFTLGSIVDTRVSGQSYEWTFEYKAGGFDATFDYEFDEGYV
jgi:hypothetical protein